MVLKGLDEGNSMRLTIGLCRQGEQQLSQSRCRFGFSAGAVPATVM